MSKSGRDSDPSSRGLHDDTLLVDQGRDPGSYFGAVNVPPHRASTIVFPTVADLAATRDRSYRGFSYGRAGTPSSRAFEEAMASLEGGVGAVVASSGVNAIAIALTSVLDAGDHVLVADCVYGPTRRFCERVLRRYGVAVTYFDPLIGANIRQLIQDNTRAIFTESPGSLTFEVQDIPAIAAAAHHAGAVLINDNTWATPLLFKSFEHGVDISVHSATKYVGGHADLLLGAIVANEQNIKRVRANAAAFGASAGADDLYLALRGLRTLSVRLERHQRNALEVTGWLQTRPEVARILYPALPSDPGHTIWQRDFAGACGLFSIVLAEEFSDDAVAAMVDGLRLFAIGASWGGFESLVLPADPARTRTATTWPANGPLLRLHIGLEDPRDLIADLASGMIRLKETS